MFLHSHSQKMKWEKIMILRILVRIINQTGALRREREPVVVGPTELRSQLCKTGFALLARAQEPVELDLG